MSAVARNTGNSLQDLGLLALRLTVPTALFLKHGLEKLHGFHTMAPHFPNPVHIGPWPSFLFAMIADGICMPLLVLGLFTRPAALWSLINLCVAWALIHHFQFFGRGAEHGELVFIYIGVMLTLLLAGPGKYSIDGHRR
ncbi:MAG TPA: DoxX family protein [Acidobacteriaceae bacterium]|jgi:putative oxidoreductase|nr:DoxX family protein [Acidobacteriaceae bacterium]